MAKSAFTAFLISVHELRAPEQRTDLSNLHGSGYDLLPLLHGMLKDVRDRHLHDEARERVLMVEDLVPAGRTVCFTAKSGRSGSEGEIVDTASGETTHSYDVNESPVTQTRNMFVIPERSKFGFLLTERYGGRGSSTIIRELTVSSFRQRFGENNLAIRIEALLDQAAWAEYIQRADMTKFTINRYARSSDIAEGVDVTSVGKVSHTVKPRRGLGRFAQQIKDGLINGDISAHRLIGIPSESTDDVAISLNDGTQGRQLLLGSNDAANLIYLIESGSDQRPPAAAVYEEMRKKVADDLSSGLSLTLGEAWAKGSWTPEQLDIGMAARRNGS